MHLFNNKKMCFRKLIIQKIAIDINYVCIEEMVDVRGVSSLWVFVGCLDNNWITLSSYPYIVKSTHSGVEPESNPCVPQYNQITIPDYPHRRPFPPCQKYIWNICFFKIWATPKIYIVSAMNQSDEIGDIGISIQQKSQLRPMLLPMLKERRANHGTTFMIQWNVLKKFISVVGLIPQWAIRRIISRHVGKYRVILWSVFSPNTQRLIAPWATGTCTESFVPMPVKSWAKLCDVILDRDRLSFNWMHCLFHGNKPFFTVGYSGSSLYQDNYAPTKHTTLTLRGAA